MLKLDTGQTISKQEDIIDSQKTFYSDLYTEKSTHNNEATKRCNEIIFRGIKYTYY
jgi:hypothetical protein